MKVEDPASASVYWPAPCSNTGTDAGDVTHHREADDRSHKPMFDLLFFGFFFLLACEFNSSSKQVSFSFSLSYQNMMSASSMDIKFKEKKYSVHPSKSLWRHSLIIFFQTHMLFYLESVHRTNFIKAWSIAEKVRITVSLLPWVVWGLWGSIRSFFPWRWWWRWHWRWRWRQWRQ